MNLASIANVPSALPVDVDLTSRITDSLDFTTPVKADAGRGQVVSAAGGSGEGDNRIYTADLVERIIMPYPDNPKPVYPPALLSSGIEASFMVQFVVDTTGHVDERSLKFPSSAHRLFVDAVQRVLRKSRYRPAEVGGHRVAQLAEQQFTFRISR